MTKQFTITAALGMFVALAAPSVHAAPVSFTIEDLASTAPDSVVYNTGDYKQGLNAGSASDDVTVNGVKFADIAEANSGDGVRIRHSAGGLVTATAQKIDNWGGDLSQLFATLWASGVSSGNNSFIDVTIEGLTLDADYRVQFLIGQQTSGGGNNDRLFTITSDASVSPQIDAGGVNNAAQQETRKAVLATFTADSTSQVFQFTRANNVNNRSMVSAVAVFQIPVPEPSTGLIAAMGLFGLLPGLRKRNRAI